MARKNTQQKKRRSITRDMLARILYRTMRIEEPAATRRMAKQAARRIRLPR